AVVDDVGAAGERAEARGAGGDLGERCPSADGQRDGKCADGRFQRNAEILPLRSTQRQDGSVGGASHWAPPVVSVTAKSEAGRPELTAADAMVRSRSRLPLKYFWMRVGKATVGTPPLQPEPTLQPDFW